MSDVLERNVRLLLRRSYVPALPAPPFRDRLESLFLGEVERHAGRRARARPRPRPLGRRLMPLRVAVALAAAVLALFLGWRLFTRDAGDPRARLLAQGSVALGLPDGSWRAADPEERVHGMHFARPALVVVTPEGAEFDVLTGRARVHVEERSEVALRDDGTGPVATLYGGTAWVVRAGERAALVAGVARALEAPEPEPVAPLARTTEAGREALVPEPPRATAPAEPPAARVLSGTVTADGQPLAAFSVALLVEKTGYETYPPVKRDFASPEGTFQWPDPPPGKQRVFVHAPGFALLALGEFDLTTELPALRAELVPGVRVHGSVLDEQGNPIPDALVFSEEEAPTDGLFFSDARLTQTFWLPTAARTGPDGRFELAHLNPGRHTLRAGAAGFAPAWELGVGAPRAEELVFTLDRGGIVQGRVERDDGGPWAGAEVVVVAMDQGERARLSFDFTRTDDDGRYRFEHLPPLTLIVVRMRVEGRPEVRPVQVVTGQTVTADFEPPRRGIRLHGRVLGRDGAPLARQNLGLFDRETASWNQDWVATTTDAAGAYEFEGVQAGRYQLFLIDEMGRELGCVDALVIPSDAVEVLHDVRVPGGRLRVSVREAQSGDPVPLTALTVSRIEEDGGESFSSVGLSDPDGRFEFTDLRPGSYVVYAYPTREGLGFARGERVNVAEGGPAEIEVLLEEGGSMSVVVRDPDGRALAGAAVLFHDENGVEHTFSRLPLTDAAGRYRASGLRPGRYRVAAHLAGHQGTPVEFRFELGRELEIPILLAPR